MAITVEVMTLQEAKRLYAEQVRRLRYGLYRVASATERGVEWTVVQTGAGVLQCTCPAGLHGRRCWHVDAVRAARELHQQPAPISVLAGERLRRAQTGAGRAA